MKSTKGKTPRKPKSKTQDLEQRFELAKRGAESSKDYTKYILGLSSGILVLTAAFLSRQAQGTDYKLIIVLGWISLTLSIILGLMIVKRSSLLLAELPIFVIMSKETKKGHEEIMKEILKGFEFDLTVKVIKDLHKEINMDKITDDDAKKLAKDKRYRKQVRKFTIKNVSKISKDLADFIDEAWRLENIAAKVSKRNYYTQLFRDMRKGVFALAYIPKYFESTFFIGLILVCLFFVLNFLK